MRFRIDPTREERRRHLRAAKLCHQVYTRAEDVHVEHAHPEDDHTYVVVEGSDSVANWRDNLDVRRIDGMHRGFARYARRCVDRYRLIDVLEQNERIVITGHSQGAAAALLIAHMLRAHTRNVVEVVLFGCPNIGDDAFSASLLEETGDPSVFLYRNGRDIVCALPFGFLGFSNALCAHTIELKPKSVGFFGPVRSHMINQYVDSLESVYV